MPEELHLVTELAIILIAAGVFTIISRALKQPLILGYIIAGFLVGPHLGLFPQFSADSIHEWSEIGIIFLLFGLGLEFSFKKLIKIGSSAFIMALVKCLGMYVVGNVVGHMLGWTSMECIFLGGLMGMSSTTIIIKAYTDMGQKDKPYASFVFGSLVFEDLIAVLLLVLLSTVAATGKFAGGEMVSAFLKLAFFIVLWFLVGIYVIPLLLKKAKKFLSDEILLLVSLGLCFGMVVLANLVGFSSALGAFVMGSILAETIEGERILKLTESIKDLFGAIFFVSVGMMVDPAVIGGHWGAILVLVLTTIFGIIVFSTAGALLSGTSLDNAVHAGFSLAQLGEFAFIIASLGCSLGVMRDFIYPIIIAVSVITTFTTPYMIKLGAPASRWLSGVLPEKVVARLNSRQGVSASSKAEKNEWHKLLGKSAVRVGLNLVMTIAVMIGSRIFLPKLFALDTIHLSADAIAWISTVGTLALMSPFLFGIVISGKTESELTRHLIKKDKKNAWGVLTMFIIRLFIALIFVLELIQLHFDLSWWSVLLIIVALCVFLIIARRYMDIYTRLEKTFMGNLNEKEDEFRRMSPVTSKVTDALSEYDVKIKKVKVSPQFEFIGRPLRDMPFRRKSGANIIKIVRGAGSILVPGGDEPVYPGDVLVAVGTSEQLARLDSMIEEHTLNPEEQQTEFAVERVHVGPDSAMAGKTLRECDMRKAGCMAVSVLHNGKISTNPGADYLIEEGDDVWIAGDAASLEWFK